MKKLTFLIVLFMLLQMAAPAQGIIKGRISQEGQAVARASVMLNEHQQLSDSSGYFVFNSLPEGKYTLNISAIGSENFHDNITLHKNEIKEIRIELVPSTSALDAVVITGTMKAVKKLESPIAVEVYTPTFFKKNPSPSIFESLQNVNGVRPQINCSVCNTGDIHINGLEGPYTMVTIDGMPIVSSLSSVYGLFGIPSDMIDRVEIVKGPASGLYGSEAIGGLINIITKSPEKAPLISAGIMTTSWHEHNVDLGARWKIKNRMHSMLGINYFNATRAFDKNEDQFTDVTLQHRISAFNKWKLDRNYDRIATLAGRYFYENRWGGDMRWNTQFRGSDSIYGESINTYRWEIIGNYQLPVHEKMFFSYSATGHKQDSYYGITPYMASQKIIFGQMTWDRPVKGNHELLIGLAGRYSYYDDNSTATQDTLSKKNFPEKNFIPGIFIQDEWKISASHTFLFGIRADHHRSHNEIFTPRIAYKWRMNEKQTLRLNAGTGFRVVNLFTEDHAALTGARAVEIIEKLKPEKSYNVNINYTNLLATGSRSFHIDASVWYSYFTNQIIADYETDPNKIIYDNLRGHAISKGFTLNMEMNILQRLKGLAGITLQDIKKVQEVNGEKMKQTPMLTESWSGTWSLTYTLPLAGLTFDYTGNIYGPMRLPLLSSLDPRKSTSPVWSIQNIQATKWISHELEFFGGIKNLLNWTPSRNNPFIIARTHDPFDKNVEYDPDGNVLSTPENPYALTFDPTYIYAPNQGIRLFAGVRWKLY